MKRIRIILYSQGDSIRARIARKEGGNIESATPSLYIYNVLSLFPRTKIVGGMLKDEVQGNNNGDESKCCGNDKTKSMKSKASIP